MYLLDSNIIIYYAEKQYKCLDTIFQEEILYVSEITRLEVLGYHRIGDLKSLFEQLFAEFNLIPISTIGCAKVRSASLAFQPYANNALHIVRHIS